MSPPKISVVMCAYNAEKYLAAAVESILRQTFTDFEFIIVDDGSTDGTAAILDDYAGRDLRINVLTNESNSGIPRSTNRGFDAASGEYIARMDSDDIAAPERFQRQVDFLDQNPDCIVVGTGYQEIDARGKIVKTDCEPASPSILRWRALFRMPLVHPSIMFRSAAIKKNKIYFDPIFDVTEDFEFIQRLLRIGNAALIPEPLIQYRMHSQNESTLKRPQQREAAKCISIRETTRLFPEISAEKLTRLYHYLCTDVPVGIDETSSAGSTMKELQTLFAENYNLSRPELRRQDALATRWLIMSILRRQSMLDGVAMLRHLLAAKRSIKGLMSELCRFAIKRLPQLEPRRFAGLVFQK